MTLSVLKGEDGGQRDELDRLISWLVQEGKPDIVHLSNALLLGLAKRIRAELGVPVVCTLQDEDSWVDSMEVNAAREAWDIMAARSQDIAAFVPVSEYYRGLMRKRLRVEEARFHVVPIGISVDEYNEAGSKPQRPTIGYLSKMTESLGLGVLVDAFLLLKKNGRLNNAMLRVMGGQTPDDGPFIQRLKAKIDSSGFADSVEFVADFDRKSRIAFLQSLSVLSVPTRHPEAFGMFVVEAMACAVPAVQPRIGAFPELVEATGGGICYEPNDPAALANALERLLLDESRRRELGQAGRKAVRDRFTIRKMAESMLEVYGQCAKR
jgi:glycosyltransferase involved in cell wall biosynthesis